MKNSFKENFKQFHLTFPESIREKLNPDFELFMESKDKGNKLEERIALYNDSFQNWKSHYVEKAQLILTDIPPFTCGAILLQRLPVMHSTAWRHFAAQSFKEPSSNFTRAVTNGIDGSRYLITIPRSSKESAGRNMYLSTAFFPVTSSSSLETKISP